MERKIYPLLLKVVNEYKVQSKPMSLQSQKSSISQQSQQNSTQQQQEPQQLQCNKNIRINSSEEEKQLIKFMKETFFKELLTELPIKEIIKHLRPMQWQKEKIIFTENQKNNDFYFLLEGSVNIYKKVYHSNNNQIYNKIHYLHTSLKQQHEEQESTMEIIGHRSGFVSFGESFFGHSQTHTFTIKCNDSIARGFCLSRKIFEEYCGNMIKQYKYITNYVCNFLNISYQNLHKIDLYQHISYKTFSYGSAIQIKDEIFIVLQGQCLMNFQQKCTQKRARRSVPYKIQRYQNQSKLRPLLKLCQMESFGMQKILTLKSQQKQKQDETLSKMKKYNNFSYSYTVTSEKIVLLAIKFSSLPLFPKQMMDKLQSIFQAHYQKQKKNIYYTENQLQFSSQKSPYSKLSKSISPQLKKHSAYTQTISLFKQQSNDQRSNLKFKQLLKDIDISQEMDLIKVSPKQLKTTNKKAYILPKINKNHFSQNLFKDNNINNNNLGRIKLNKTESKPYHNLQNKHHHQTTELDIVHIRKKYCLGFDLKTKCSGSNNVNVNVSPQKKIIGQPKGYFTRKQKSREYIDKINEMNKQNSRSYHLTKRGKNDSVMRRQWGEYLNVKLPSINESLNLKQK